MPEANALPTDTEINVNDLPKELAAESGNKKVFVIAGVIVVVLIALFSVWFLGSRNNNAVESLTSQAQTAYLSADFKGAQEKYKQALLQDKNNPRVLAGLINSISLQGNQTGTEKKALQDSQNYINEALKAGPNNTDVLIAVGYAYETAGDYQKALGYYNQAIKADPNSSAAYFHAGHALEFLGKRAEAYKDYEKAYSLDPNNSLVLVARGNMLLSQGKTQESYDSFKKAAQAPGISAQTKSEALTAASLVRVSQDNFAHVNEATELAKQAVAADPNFSPALATYGYDLYLSGNNNQAIEYLKKAIAANPRISKNYLLLAQIYRAEGDYTDGINYDKQALAHVDEDNTILSSADKQTIRGDYTYDLAKTYSLSKLPVDTLALIKQAIALNPAIKKRVQSEVGTGPLFKELIASAEFKQILTSK